MSNQERFQLTSAKKSLRSSISPVFASVVLYGACRLQAIISSATAPPHPVLVMSGLCRPGDGMRRRTKQKQKTTAQMQRNKQTNDKKTVVRFKNNLAFPQTRFRVDAPNIGEEKVVTRGKNAANYQTHRTQK